MSLCDVLLLFHVAMRDSIDGQCAQVHCLLQLRRLADAKQKQMLIVEVADVGHHRHGTSFRHT